VKILFIHRSVGQHLLIYGDLRAKLEVKGIKLDDYNNNAGTLTQNDGTTDNSVISMPGNNTNPDNLEAFFSNWNGVLNNYNLIMTKSCYPNSHIKSDEQLEKIKTQYTSIINAFNNHKKSLLILTTPPLRPITTNNSEAERADELANWLVNQAKGNIHVFDFRKMLANKRGMLKAGYRHWSMPWDNHPKAIAHKTIAPQLATYIMTLL